jgi:hypothetical protein
MVEQFIFILKIQILVYKHVSLQISVFNFLVELLFYLFKIQILVYHHAHLLIQFHFKMEELYS